MAVCSTFQTRDFHCCPRSELPPLWVDLREGGGCTDAPSSLLLLLLTGAYIVFFPHVCNPVLRIYTHLNRIQKIFAPCSKSVGSVSFWDSRIRQLELQILRSSSKSSKKNLDFFSFVTSLWTFNLWSMM